MPIYKINNNLTPSSQQQQNHIGPHLNFPHNTRNEIQNSKGNEASDSPVLTQFTSLKRSTDHIRSASETIVEREIRKQLEKEKEIQALHSIKTAGTNGKNNSHPQVNEESCTRSRTSETSYLSAANVLKRDSSPQNHSALKTPLPTTQVASDIKHRAIKQKPIVHPFEDDENEMESKLKFIQPQKETVIEKEVRLTMQRESSLRRARGYPLQVHHNESGVEVPVLNLNTPAKNEASNRDAADVNGPKKEQYNARRLATNRLKQEILKERQREIDLMNQGKIKTLSEERAALDASIIEELVNKELEERKRLAKSNNGLSTLPAKQTVPIENVKFKRPDHCPVSSFPNGSEKNSSPRTEMHTSKLHEKVRINETCVDAEARIEEEIKEIKRREEELRIQRGQLGLSPTSSTSGQSTFITSYRRR